MYSGSDDIVEIEGRRYQRACRIEQMHLRRPLRVTLENGQEVVVLLLPTGEYRAFSNVCLHLKVPVLADGIVDVARQTLTCPLHNWCYSLEDGRVLGGGRAKLQQFALRIDRGWIWIELPDDELELPAWLKTD